MFEKEINNNMNSSINGGGVTRIYRNSGNSISMNDRIYQTKKFRANSFVNKI